MIFRAGLISRPLSLTVTCKAGELTERKVKSMAMKHRITINVTDPDGKRASLLRGADMKLPARLVRFLFGDFQQIYLLSPGKTIESVNIREVRKGGKTDVEDESVVSRA